MPWAITTTLLCNHLADACCHGQQMLRRACVFTPIPSFVLLKPHSLYKNGSFFLFRMSVDGNKEPLVEEGWECNNRGMENEWRGGWMKRSRTPSFFGPHLCISPFIIVRGAIYGHGRGDRAMPVRTGDFERTQRHERKPKYIFKSKSVHSAAILVILVILVMHLCTHMLFQIIIIIIDIAIINK